MKRICALIMLAALALGQNCDLSNLVPFGNGFATSQPGDNSGGNDGGTTNRGRPGINANPSGSPRPEVGAEIAIVVVSQSRQDADIVVRYLVGSTEVRRTELHVPAGATLPPIGPDLAVVVAITGKHANGVILPQTTLQLGQQFEAGDVREFVILDPDDLCPGDVAKYEPGQCGCGVADTDTDGDGVPDCQDACPVDPSKTAPGACGCGQEDSDTDADGTPDCTDACPVDPHKTQPGLCGCGVPDISYPYGSPETTLGCPIYCTDPTLDTDADGVTDCYDGCPMDVYKTSPGACGCYEPDSDSDEDAIPDCIDGCPDDTSKAAPGLCGCGTADIDTDTDGTPDCSDGCPADPLKTSAGVCGCGTEDVDSDADTYADCIDGCPTDQTKTSPGECGCGVPEGACAMTQACCVGSVECSDLTYESCLASYGTPQGTGTTCATTMCYITPMLEACCMSSTCAEMPVGQCSAYGGLPYGPGTTCVMAPCYMPPMIEACCMNETCIEMPVDQCLLYSGTPLGTTTCESPSCSVLP